jgi:hypothetical protein
MFISPLEKTQERLYKTGEKGKDNVFTKTPSRKISYIEEPT